MNAVLGFELGEIDLSVPNATGTILKMTVPATSAINITSANDTFVITYNGTVHTFTFTLGNNYAAAGFATAIENIFTQLAYPMTCTFDAVDMSITCSSSRTLRTTFPLRSLALV